MCQTFFALLCLTFLGAGCAEVVSTSDVDPALADDDLAKVVVGAPLALDGEIDALADPVHYTCGWALPGYGCDNGRAHGEVYVSNMQSAIAACLATKPAGLSDFCYVIAAQGGSSADASLCGFAGGSWRAAHSCCNFLGSTSCPTTATQFRCGYALPGYGCNNGRGSVLISAFSMSGAISACYASQPSNLPDFCYVRHTSTGAASDESQCAMSGGSWRPGSACCNFRGSVSCP